MTPALNGQKIVPLFGIPVRAMTMDEAVGVAEQAIERRQRLLVGVVNAAKVVNMQRDAGLREAVLSADMILADGISVVWAARLLRRPLPERVTGIDLMVRLLELANGRGYRVFCLGATEEVVNRVAERIRQEFPAAQLAGVRNGYYSPEQEEDIAREIGASRADMLFVAMTSPRKEVFLARWADTMQVPVCHGVGGAFDVLAGKVQRAPRTWQALGLEWLYRLLQEPGRLWKRYLETNAAFTWLLARQLFAERGMKPAAAGGAQQVKGTRDSNLHVADVSRDPQTESGGACVRPSVELITRPEALLEMRAEWNELLSDSAANSIFLTHEWIDAWMRSMRHPVRPVVLVARDAHGRLAGLGPFYLATMRLVNTVRYRTLRVLGDRDSGAEYPDLIVRRGLEAPVMAAFHHALMEHGPRWDCIWLPQTASWTGAMERIAVLTGGKNRFRVNQRTTDFARITLPRDEKTLELMLSGNMRSNLRRARRRAEQCGGVRLVHCQSPPDLAAMLPRLFELHARARQARGQESCFERRPAMRRFYESFAPLALARGWLALFGLQVGETLAAVQYGYVYDGVFHQMQEGYDPDAPEGTGNVLREQVMHWCIERNLREYDFLGEFTEHKRRWGAAARFGADVLIGRPTHKTRLLFARPVWPTGRFLRPFEPVSTKRGDSRAMEGVSR